jgi:hypothetical protein
VVLATSEGTFVAPRARIATKVGGMTVNGSTFVANRAHLATKVDVLAASEGTFVACASSGAGASTGATSASRAADLEEPTSIACGCT